LPTRTAGEVAARLLHRLYIDAGGSGIGDAISRVTALSNEATRADEDEVYSAYAYNGAGRIVLETQKHEGDTVAELDYYQGTAGTYAGFDRFGRVQDQKWTDGTDPIDRYGYGYDRNSNRLYRENVLAATRSEVYAYDMLDRLAGMDRGTLNEQKTAITGTPTREEDWNLNQTGNWAGYDVAVNGAAILNQTRDNNKANEIIAIDRTTGPEWLTPEWDARGNMLSGPVPGDEDARQHYTWDAWNRLVAVYADDSGEPGDLVATYRYDGQNHRIRKLLGTNPEDPDTAYDYYYNESWQIVETRKDGSVYKQYVWGIRYIDAPVLRDRDTGGDPDLDETLYYTNDANMNVTALVEPDGDVAERVVYDPYGKPEFYDDEWGNPSDSSAFENAILYCGYRFDNETGLYHVRHRMYHPTLGRWMQRDRIGYVDGMNLYEYTAGNPVTAADPMGEFRGNWGSWGVPTVAAPTRDIGIKVFHRRKHGNDPGHTWIRMGEGDRVGFKPTAVEGKAGAWLSLVIGQRGQIEEDTEEYKDNEAEDKWPAPQVLSRVRRIQAGEAEGTLCACATRDDVISCIDAVANDWRHARYWLLFQNCRDFVLTALNKCCLICKQTPFTVLTRPAVNAEIMGSGGKQDAVGQGSRRGPPAP